MISQSALRALIFGGLALCAVACDKDSDDSDNPIAPETPGESNAVGNKPEGDPSLSETTCESAWAAYVKQNPKGLATTYEKTTLTSTAGASLSIPDSTTKSVSKSLVTESSDVQVVVEASNGSSTTVTKELFVDSCDKVEIPNAPLEILEKNEQTITVAAGIFPTTYVKSRFTGLTAGPEAPLLETWTSTGELPILVKSISVFKTQAGETTVTVTSTNELIELVLP